jgi:hypothetical protein
LLGFGAETLDPACHEGHDRTDVLVDWPHGVGDERSLWVYLKADSQFVHYLPGLPHVAPPNGSSRFESPAMKVYIRTDCVDQPEVGARVLSNQPPSFAGQLVSSAVEHHGVVHSQVFSKKRCLKVIGEITNAFKAEARGWVDRKSCG